MKHVPALVLCVAAIAACDNRPPDPAAAWKGPTYDTREPASFETVRTTSTVAVEDLPKVPCPDDMVEVEGDYCPNVEQVCLRWVGIHGQTVKESGSQTGRCGEFQKPSRCLSKQTVHKHFCIDTYEYPNTAGQRPRSWMTWYDAKSALEARGERLCTADEWTLACEGPDMQPYPYGDGYTRDRAACNFDNPVPKGLDVFNAKRPTDLTSLALDWMLAPAGSMPGCVSPYGVYDMVGNLDELVVNESGHPYKSGLKGGHVFGVRNACRPMTTGHNEGFGWYETSTRGCRDVQQ